MALAFQCPSCGNQYKATNDMAGRTMRCQCGISIMIQGGAPAAPRATTSGAASQESMLRVSCPSCQRTRTVPRKLAGKKGKCACGTVFRIAAVPPSARPATPPAATPVIPPAAPVTASVETSSLFDELTDNDWSDDLKLEPLEPAPRPRQRSDNEVLAQYAGSERSLSSRRREYGRDDPFAPEKRGLDAGMFGGLIMMGIAAVWFLGGLAFGVIFLYAPILFVIGVFGFLRGLLTGNLAGRR